MKSVFRKLFIFSVGMFLILLLYVLSFGLGRLDFYYKRISSSKQGSMVLGVSRAAQGIVPSEINKVCSGTYTKVYNFAFAANYSPYGSVYLNAIKLKISNSSIPNGLFILTVDPRSLSIDKYNFSTFEKLDNESFLNHMNSFSQNPNLDYILYGHESYYKKVFLNFLRGEGYLHDDGWLEIKLGNTEQERNNRLDSKLSDKNYELDYFPSDYRLNYFIKTIDFLDKYGDVFIVRMPVHQEILKRQNLSYPSFDNIIDSIALIRGLNYFNYTVNKHDQYFYTDGSHLTAESARLFTRDLANRILKYSRNGN